MTTDPDSPLLSAAYGPDDMVMRDGRPMVRSGIFISTAVTGDPVSVFVTYLPADDLIAQAAEMFGPIEPDDDDDPPMSGRSTK